MSLAADYSLNSCGVPMMHSPHTFTVVIFSTTNLVLCNGYLPEISRESAP